MSRVRVLLCGLAFGTLTTSCSALVDSGVVYRECDREHVGEEFESDTTLETLLERCWSFANDEDNVSVEDGDLIVVVSNPSPSNAQRWSAEGQGPMVYQRFEGDFLLAARLEVLDKVSGDLCLAPGNAVGLVARQTDPALAWSTLLISPFEPTEPVPGLDCKSDSEVTYPIQADVTNRDGAWGPDTRTRGESDLGVAFLEGETDLAMCRKDEALVFYYREPTSAVDAAVWTAIGEPHDATGALDVGPTASGAEGSFEVEGHFTWTEYTDRLGPDGCRGALERLSIPVVD